MSCTVTIVFSGPGTPPGDDPALSMVASMVRLVASAGHTVEQVEINGQSMAKVDLPIHLSKENPP